MTIYAGENILVRDELTDDRGDTVVPLPATWKASVEKKDGTSVVALTAGSVRKLGTGTASSGSGDTLVDATKAWRVNQWRGFGLRITAGVGSNQERRILSNTATTLTLDSEQVVNQAPIGALSPAPDATSAYFIHDSTYEVLLLLPSSSVGLDLLLRTEAESTSPVYKSSHRVPFKAEANTV